MRRSQLKMRRLVVLATALFGVFLLWILFLADTGRDSVFFRLARSLPLGDKIAHFLLFGLLAFGLNLSLRLRCFQVRGLKLPAGPAILLVVVVAEEFSQAFIPFRTLDAGDLLGDVLGISLFTWLTYRPFFRRHFASPPKGDGAARPGGDQDREPTEVSKAESNF